jgi:sterol desaturase/sphingolipid hydroxylase (fatty acid hydroxylase superfamily)
MSVINVFLLLAAGIVGGVIVTEVTGYVWHRYVEHKGKFGNKVREAHVHHHYIAYPMETLRRPTAYISSRSWSWYVLAAGLSVVVLGISYVIGQLLGGVAVIVCGALYGKYVINSMHEAFHVSKHPLDSFAWFRRLRRYHDIHHLLNCNYGIVFMTMDRLCGTFLKDVTSAQLPEDIFPGVDPATVERLKVRVVLPHPGRTGAPQGGPSRPSTTPTSR